MAHRLLISITKLRSARSRSPESSYELYVTASTAASSSESLDFMVEKSLAFALRHCSALAQKRVDRILFSPGPFRPLVGPCGSPKQHYEHKRSLEAGPVFELISQQGEDRFCIIKNYLRLRNLALHLRIENKHEYIGKRFCAIHKDGFWSWFCPGHCSTCVTKIILEKILSLI